MKFKNFFDMFPVPKFIDIPYGGLSISDTHVRCIQFASNGSGLYVKKFIEKPISQGIVISGFINNSEEIVRVLESIKKELDLKYVKVSLPEEKAYLFTTKIPCVRSREVRSTIEFTIEENVPLPADELSFDYTVADTGQKSDHISVVVSSVPTKIIDSYIDIIQKVGLPLLALEVESQATARALIPQGVSDTRLIVNFGPGKVGLYVVYKRIVHFTSTVIMTTQTNDDLTVLSHEIKKLYAYWHMLKENVGEKSKQISQIIVCGEKVDDATISFLALQHDTQTQMGDVWTNVCDITKTIPPISFADSLRYVTPIGLALPSDILI